MISLYWWTILVKSVLSVIKNKFSYWFYGMIDFTYYLVVLAFFSFLFRGPQLSFICILDDLTLSFPRTATDAISFKNL